MMTPQVQHYQVQHYIEKLQDQDRGVRKEAIAALGQIGDVAAVPALIERLQDDFMGVRMLAAIELGNLQDDSAVPGLIQALEDEEWIVRKEAVAALWKLDDAPAVPALLERLQDSVYQVRTLAALELGRHGELEAIPHIVTALVDQNDAVRKWAVRILTQIGVPAVPELLQAIRYERKQWMAAHVLEQIGDSTTLPRKILAERRLSAQERIAALDDLRKVRCQLGDVPFRYTFPPTRALCKTVLEEEDEAARAGAQTVLNWLNGDRHLLQASQRNTEPEAQELLRAARNATSEQPPETLLRGASAPEEHASSSPPRRLTWEWVLGKRRP